MSNSIGLIDGGYRGEIMASCDNIKDYDYEIKEGQRLSDLRLIKRICGQILNRQWKQLKSKKERRS